MSDKQIVSNSDFGTHARRSTCDGVHTAEDNTTHAGQTLDTRLRVRHLAREIWSPALLIWLFLLRLYDPLSPNLVAATSFNRVFGQATASGIDAQKRILSMLVYNLVFGAVCLIAASAACYWLIVKSHQHGTADGLRFRSLLNVISIVGIVNIVVLLLAEFNKQTPLYYSVQLLFPLFIATILLGKWNVLGFERAKWALFAGLPITFVAVSLNRSLMSSVAWLYQNRLALIYSVVLIVLLVALAVFPGLRIERLQVACIPLFFAMPVTSVFLEFTNILNQHGVFVVQRALAAKVILASFVLVSALIYLSKRAIRPRKWETPCWLGLILGVAGFSQQPPLTIKATTDLFEQANHGMLVFDLFHSGKIPLLQSFDGHQLANSMGGIVFGLLNGGASTTIDASYFMYSFTITIIGVALFFLLKALFDAEFAILVVLFVPITGVYLSIYLIVVLALLYCIRRGTVLSFGLFYASIAATAIWEVPPAVAIGVGSVAVLVLIIVFDCLKERALTLTARRFVTVSLCAILLVGVLYVVVCIAAGINPVSRAREFLAIVNSNNAWSYTNIGNTSTIAFYLAYFVVPALIVLEGAYLLNKLRSEIATNPTAITILTFCIAYFANYSRMLGRHSLAERTPVTAIMFAVIPLSLLAVIAATSIKRGFFVFVFLGMPLITTFTLSTSVSLAAPLMNNAMQKYLSDATFQPGATERVARVDYSSVLKTHAPVLYMINTMIPANETYVDLSSQTMLYALSGREKPVYINQSPLELSGEYSQEMFIDQITVCGANCSYALLGSVWMGLDGVDVRYRYYKVFEYLNARYEPLCQSVDGFQLWVSKDRYGDAHAKLESLATDGKIPGAQFLATSTPLNDSQWDNGVLRADPAIVAFQNNQSLQFAETVTTPDGTALRISSVQQAGNYQWVRFEDPDAAEKAARATSLSYSVSSILLPYTLTGGPTATSDYYDLGYIPFLWGTYDTGRAFDNQVLVDLTKYDELPLQMQSISNYILLQVKSESDGQTVSLLLLSSNGEPVVTYVFETKAGEHSYLIRPSSDPYWGTGVVLTYSVVFDAGTTNLSSVLLLQGD